jgi:16S rRNA (adenine1518-N6/adenine1519-N6)-dimethyltransferase
MSQGLPYARKSLGQHWLQDQDTLEAMAEAAAVQAGDTVLEIGPGIGTLTATLLEHGADVIAVEFDEILAQTLPQNVPHHVSEDFADNTGQAPADFIRGHLQVVQSDILKFDLTSLPADYKITANIPYYLTSNLLRVISETPNPASRGALLVQKEVAQRVTAAPGRMSILGVSMQSYWEVSAGQVVAAELFTPPPKVDSQILVLQRRPTPLFGSMDERRFFRVVKAGFSSKRKTLRNTISAGLHISKIEAEAALNSAGIDAGLRPEALSIQQWVALAAELLP